MKHLMYLMHLMMRKLATVTTKSHLSVKQDTHRPFTMGVDGRSQNVTGEGVVMITHAVVVDHSPRVPTRPGRSDMPGFRLPACVSQG